MFSNTISKITELNERFYKLYMTLEHHAKLGLDREVMPPKVTLPEL